MTTDNNLAIVFPGQGSQSVGMLSNLSLDHPIIRTTYEEASQILGFDLWELSQHGPETKLNATINTQPALLAAGVAVWRVWQELGGTQPAVFAGHSLGEYTALVCADVLSYKDAIGLVADRGKYMQQAIAEGEGAMAAILGLENAKVIDICQQLNGAQVVSAANFNAPGQVVIAGHKSAVQNAIEHAKQAHAKRAILLPVSVPSHCILMKQAATKLAERMEKISFSDAKIPIIQNVDVKQRTYANEIKQALLEQLCQPVYWVDTIFSMQSAGIKRIIECGPGKVLTGLIKRIDRSLQTFAIFDSDSLQTALSVE